MVISCVLAKGKTAKFTWTKNGVLLHDDNRLQITNLRRASTLNIDDVESSDRGVYTCTATDEDSEDRQSTSLSVEGTPSEHNDNNQDSRIAHPVNSANLFFSFTRSLETHCSKKQHYQSLFFSFYENAVVIRI